jgi:hypothetical protein
MKKIIGFALLLLGTAGSLMAFIPSPEMDPGSGLSAVLLISGGLLVLRAARKR